MPVLMLMLLFFFSVLRFLFFYLRPNLSCSRIDENFEQFHVCFMPLLPFFDNRRTNREQLLLFSFAFTSPRNISKFLKVVSESHIESCPTTVQMPHSPEIFPDNVNSARNSEISTGFFETKDFLEEKRKKTKRKHFLIFHYSKQT